MTNGENRFDNYRELVQPAIVSKIEEFHLFGYDHVTEMNLWEYLQKKVWKRAAEEKALYEIVGDILSVKVGDFMNFTTIQAYQSADWFSGDGREALKDLL